MLHTVDRKNVGHSLLHSTTGVKGAMTVKNGLSLKTIGPKWTISDCHSCRLESRMNG